MGTRAMEERLTVAFNADLGAVQLVLLNIQLDVNRSRIAVEHDLPLQFLTIP